MSHSATVFTGIAQLVLPDAEERNLTPLSVVHDAFLWISDGRVVATGQRADLPRDAPANQVDLGGRCVLPGLVDSHTHVCFAGARIDEMARRARGETYESIAQAGGGIKSSVAALHGASESALVEQSTPRLRHMMARGTTTCEIKSGYGLVPEQELKHLRAVAGLAQQTPVSVRATALAHVPSPSMPSGDCARLFCDEVLRPAVREGLAHYVDVFVEHGAFSSDDARLIARTAKELRLGIKLHVDQLRDGGGAALAAELHALSADHLEFTHPAGRQAMAAAGVVATILPGCGMFLGKGPWPDGRALRDAGCTVAVATDCNPGSSMVSDLFLCATLAATRCGLSLEEALWGITRGGAKALGLNDRGRLAPQERADFVVLDHDDWRAALYYPANVPIHGVAIQGAWASKS